MSRSSTRFQTPRPHDDGATALLVAESLRVEFGAIVAVNDVSFTLGAGDLLGLIGPNGAGKTTLLRTMAGLQPPVQGTTHIMGFDVFGSDEQVRRHIGFAPDAPPLYDELTINQFLTFIALAYQVSDSVASERIDFWLEQLWLADRRDDKIATLSHGMRQRVTIARTLVPNPNVILLDEPSAGLDPAGRIQFRAVLASLRDQGKALVVSSHILADLEEYCTHIAIIEGGRILRFGTVGELQGRTVGRCHYELTLAGDDDRLTSVLGGVEGVSAVACANGVWTFEYDEGPEPAARLLEALVKNGVPVASFAPAGDDLEQIYLRSGVKQVD